MKKLIGLFLVLSASVPALAASVDFNVCKVDVGPVFRLGATRSESEQIAKMSSYSIKINEQIVYAGEIKSEAKLVIDAIKQKSICDVVVGESKLQ